jgi:hypothetical protein
VPYVIQLSAPVAAVQVQRVAGESMLQKEPAVLHSASVLQKPLAVALNVSGKSGMMAPESTPCLVQRLSVPWSVLMLVIL